MPPAPATSTGLALTNPLFIYRALLSTKQIDPDPEQHRLALELQKLYHRLKDYSPQVEYGARIKALSQTAQKPLGVGEDRQLAVPGHPLRRNPLFAHLFAQKEERETRALTRVLTSHEAALNLSSPKGFLLHGEVGTGKSMFLDLLADSLPNRRKKRWHFNTFMLETLAQLEQLRRSRSRAREVGESEHSLLLIATDLIEKSPILFLDEFQLPDRAASKILSNLFTIFFQLGGVLIASSNRMPDELAKASGIDYTAPSRGGFARKLFGYGGGSGGGRRVLPANNEYAGFVEVLKARCDIYNLSGRDWRRREVEEVDTEGTDVLGVRQKGLIEKLDIPGEVKGGDKQIFTSEVAKPSTATENSDSSDTIKFKTPRKYILSTTTPETWKEVIHSILPPETRTPIPWESTSLIVYGRQVPIPRHLAGVSYWTFQDLCGGLYGPADYITLASTFHTLIVEDVPVLTVLLKNEARRMITLLDALYEARCKLLIRAAVGPDDLFFPESKSTSSFAFSSSSSQSSSARSEGSQSQMSREEEAEQDAVYPETLSEIYQDQTSPFRPNISSYSPSSSSPISASTSTRSSSYDPNEDSDFGPVPGRGNEIGRTVDFGMTSSFTGEDERFAYKRASSRLWELCSRRWHERSDEGWWRPVPIEVRRWERPRVSSSSRGSVITGDDGANGNNSQDIISGPRSGFIARANANHDVKMTGYVELDVPAGLQGKELEEERARKVGRANPPLESGESAGREEPVERIIDSPFREKRDPPTKIGWTHAWGMVKWGKRAGAWGQGPEGLGERKK